MDKKEFEVLINGQKVVLPFVGVKQKKTSAKPKKNSNYLFLGSDFVYNKNISFLTLKVMFNGREMLAPSCFKDVKTGIVYNFVDIERLGFNEVFTGNMEIVKENFPVIYKSDLDVKKIFSAKMCGKYFLPEYAKQGRPVAVYDLIERKFKLMGENFFASNYKIKKIFCNDSNSYLCIKSVPEYRFLVEFDKPNMAYVKNGELRLTKNHSFFEIFENGNVGILEHDERFSCFNSDRFDLPFELSELKFDGMSVFNLANFRQVGSIRLKNKSSIIDGISAFENGKEKEVFELIPLSIKEYLYDTMEVFV